MKGSVPLSRPQYAQKHLFRSLFLLRFCVDLEIRPWPHKHLKLLLDRFCSLAFYIYFFSSLHILKANEKKIQEKVLLLHFSCIHSVYYFFPQLNHCCYFLPTLLKFLHANANTDRYRSSFSIKGSMRQDTAPYSFISLFILENLHISESEIEPIVFVLSSLPSLFGSCK